MQAERERSDSALRDAAARQELALAAAAKEAAAALEAARERLCRDARG